MIDRILTKLGFKPAAPEFAFYFDDFGWPRPRYIATDPPAILSAIKGDLASAEIEHAKIIEIAHPFDSNRIIYGIAFINAADQALFQMRTNLTCYPLERLIATEREKFANSSSKRSRLSLAIGAQAAANRLAKGSR